MRLALSVAISWWAVAASAATFEHQGRLLDPSGQPVQGSTDLVFRLYAGPSDPTPLWTETQTAVAVADGYYDVALGAVTAIPDNLMSSDRYLTVQIGAAAESAPRQRIRPVPLAQVSLAAPALASPPVACSDASHAGRMYFDTTIGSFRGCDGVSWGTIGGADVPSGGAGTLGDPGRSCLDIHTTHPSLGSGLYYIDPDGDGASVQVQCDMTRAGGGWTFGIKTWYQSGMAGQQGAVGAVANALTFRGAGYKLADQTIRDIIGPSNNFDILMDQQGHRAAYSSGNYEYATLENYTGFFTYGGLVPASTTPTTIRSFRASDGALAWTGYLGCGSPGGASSRSYGVNCYNIDVGTNPAGGSGCSFAMGSTSNSGWHYFFMGNDNTDTYLYLCNSAQASSDGDMNHRFWFRERQPPRTNTLGLQGNPGRTCKDIKTRQPSFGDGIYWIDPEADGNPMQVHCDMTRAGGGWTLGLKVWYQSGIFGSSAAAGTINDGLIFRGGNYKLSDDDIRDIVGPTNNFDVLMDQQGHRAAYSSGNYEYATLTNYTGSFTFASLMPESTTTTAMTSYRARDNAVAWTGRLACGAGGGVATGSKGINCYNVASGTNPGGGSGCSISMGSTTNSGWHYFYMSNDNSDTYLYLCNGAQASSDGDMNHRFWFRERN
jgi:hypothetical protein